MEEEYIKSQYVTPEIAMTLKELGFDEAVCAIFRKDRIYSLFGFERINSFKKSVIAAPLWQQVIDWFGERYDINIIVGKNSKEMLEYVKTKDLTINVEDKLFWWYFVDQPQKGTAVSYSKAREQAILKAIELISEK